MQLIYDAVHRSEPVLSEKGYVITLGNYDGVHIGHRALLERAGEEAKRRNLPLLIFTFWPHSGELVPGRKIQRIYNEEQKQRVLETILPDAVLLRYAFDETLRDMDEAVFFEEILCKRYHARAIVVGDDFRYGHKGKGNVESLKKHCEQHGIDLYPIQGVEWNNERVSSTRIRTLLAQGQVKDAEMLLGQPYFLEGVVQHGKQLGRKMGFPTVNLLLEEGIAEPRRGVYMTRVYTPDGVYYGVTNVGLNPTVEHGCQCKAETHILDYQGDLYGQRIRVEFLEWKRDEQKWSDVEALQKQLQKDITDVRESIRMLSSSQK